MKRSIGVDPRQRHRGVRPGDVLQRRLRAAGRDEVPRPQAGGRQDSGHQREQGGVPGTGETIKI